MLYNNVQITKDDSFIKSLQPMKRLNISRSKIMDAGVDKTSVRKIVMNA